MLHPYMIFNIFPHLLQISTMEGSKVEAKRVYIRSQHRKEQIESLFANKRKIMLNRELNQPQPQRNFMHYYKLLNEGNTQIRNMRELANFLCQDKPFECFDQRGSLPSKQIIQEYCFSLTSIVLSLARQHKTDNKEDVDYRITCLTLVSNLLADPQTNNQLVCSLLCQFLKDIYYNLDTWGIDPETKQVGWLVGNLIGKSIATSSQLNDITYILEWIEELLSIPDVDMLTNIYRNLPKFLNQLQYKYGLPSAELPESYKSNIINIIVQTIQKNLSPNLPARLLIKVVDFLSNKIYVCLAYCPKAMSEIVVSKVMTLLGLMSLQCLKSAFRFLDLSITALLKDLAPYERRILESMESIRIYIIENYSPKLIQLLAIREAKVKTEIFRFLHSLLESPSKHIYYLIDTLVSTGLEDVLFNLIKYNQNQIKYDCLHLAVLINRLTKGRYASEFLEKVGSQQNSILHGANDSHQNPI